MRGGESQGGREPHLAEKVEDQSGSMDRKGWTPQLVNEGRFQGGQGGQATRASLEQVEGSMSG